MTSFTTAKSRLFVIGAIFALHRGRPDPLDVCGNPHVCLSEKFHAFRVLFGLGPGNDETWARPRRKAFGDLDGRGGIDAGIRSSVASHQALFSGCLVPRNNRRDKRPGPR